MNSCNKIHKTSYHGPVAVFILKLRSWSLWTSKETNDDHALL